MRRLIISTAIAACCLVAPLFVATQAQAGVEACGNIHVEASAECKLEVEGGCTARCTPVHFEAACAAKGYANCKGNCNLPSVDCEASCQAECSGTCSTNPNFKCNAECTGSVDADCDGQCKASGNKGECKAQCRATIEGQCEASCSGAPVTCQGQCEGSCKGHCKIDANLECHGECQANFSGSCYAEMEGGCKIACESPDGALFCNGQYIDHGGNAKKCIDALNAFLAANVDVSASASWGCGKGGCEGEVSASATCGGGTIANKSLEGSAPYALGLLGAIGALAFARSRRRQK